jgi:hypothetical protein
MYGPLSLSLSPSLPLSLSLSKFKDFFQDMWQVMTDEDVHFDVIKMTSKFEN